MLDICGGLEYIKDKEIMKMSYENVIEARKHHKTKKQRRIEAIERKKKNLNVLLMSIDTLGMREKIGRVRRDIELSENKLHYGE